MPLQYLLLLIWGKNQLTIHFKWSMHFSIKLQLKYVFKLTSSCLFFLHEVYASSIEINELEWPKCNDKTCVGSAGYFRFVKSHPSCCALIIFTHYRTILGIGFQYSLVSLEIIGFKPYLLTIHQNIRSKICIWQFVIPLYISYQHR